MSDAPAIEMPRYQCHKEVWALKIASVHWAEEEGKVRLCFDIEDYAPMVVPASMVGRYFPQAGDYLVVYDDGYQSFSPAKAFEEGYTRISPARQRPQCGS
jgi:hypothetical protein